MVDTTSIEAKARTWRKLAISQIPFFAVCIALAWVTVKHTDHLQTILLTTNNSQSGVLPLDEVDQYKQAVEEDMSVILEILGKINQRIREDCHKMPLPEKSATIPFLERWLREEKIIEVRPYETTQVVFPRNVDYGFKHPNSDVKVDKAANVLVVSASESLKKGGEPIVVFLDDGTFFPLRIIKAADPASRRVSLNATEAKTLCEVNAQPRQATPSAEAPR
jgi:hypothetical protein